MSEQEMSGNGALFWSFGFGSNMNVELAQTKKGLKVVDHVCASLSGWKVAFTMGGMEYVEPSFADAQRTGRPSGSIPTILPRIRFSGSDGWYAAQDEIHGVALALSADDMEKLDAQEGVNNPTRGYRKEKVTISAYDGRELEAYIYCAKNAKDTELPCSKRYLNVLVQGARAAGLNPAYIDKLASLPTYSPSEETIKTRESLPAMQALPRMSVEELAATKPKEGEEDASTHTLVSVMGYVMQVPKEKVFFGRHKARDITSRQSRQWRGLAMDDGDDWGKPPFRLPAGSALAAEPCRAPSLESTAPTCQEEEGEGAGPGTLSADEHRFVLTWLDHYLWKAGGAAGVVAFVSELREQWEAQRARFQQHSARPTAC